MLRAPDLRLPADDGWGELQLTTAAPDAGTRWTVHLRVVMYFAASKAAFLRRSPTAGLGTGPVRLHSIRVSMRPRWPVVRTTCDTHACPRGSMGEWHLPRLPSGPDIALRSCYAPTLAVLTASTTSPSAESRKPSMTHRVTRNEAMPGRATAITVAARAGDQEGTDEGRAGP
jgi:hypothetical protein